MNDYAMYKVVYRSGPEIEMSFIDTVSALDFPSAMHCAVDETASKLMDFPIHHRFDKNNVLLVGYNPRQEGEYVALVWGCAPNLAGTWEPEGETGWKRKTH